MRWARRLTPVGSGHKVVVGTKMMEARSSRLLCLSRPSHWGRASASGTRWDGSHSSSITTCSTIDTRLSYREYKRDDPQSWRTPHSLACDRIRFLRLERGARRIESCPKCYTTKTGSWHDSRRPESRPANDLTRKVLYADPYPRFNEENINFPTFTKIRE